VVFERCPGSVRVSYGSVAVTTDDHGPLDVSKVSKSPPNRLLCESGAGHGELWSHLYTIMDGMSLAIEVNAMTVDFRLSTLHACQYARFLTWGAAPRKCALRCSYPFNARTESSVRKHPSHSTWERANPSSPGASISPHECGLRANANRLSPLKKLYMISRKEWLS
jgi:hypothetical protein